MDDNGELVENRKIDKVDIIVPLVLGLLSATEGGTHA